MEKVFLSIMRAYNAHHDQARIGFKKLGLTDGQPKVLFVLRDNPGYFQKDLAERCGVTPPTMAVLLSKMETQCLIRREDFLISPGNYAKKVFATEEGDKKTDELLKFVDELEEKTLSGFTAEEQKILTELLARVKDNLLM